MTKSMSTGLRAHYALGTTTLATCWKATLTNGTVVAATTHAEDIVFDGVTYLSVAAFNTSTIETGSELNPDNLEVDGFLASPGITDTDIHSGIWDYAAIEMFEVNYKDLSQGKNILRSGTLGQVRGGRSKFTAELRGLTQKYSRRIVRLMTEQCNADLGDARCKVDLAPWTRTFAVQSVTDDYLLVNSSGIEPLNWFTGGKVTFTSGANNGLSMEVKRSAGSQFELQERMPFTVAVGDTFTVYAGCMKRKFEDCLGKFDNVLNFRGFDALPGSAVYGMNPASKRGVISPAPGPGGAPAPAPTPSPPATPGPAPAPGPIPPAVDGFPTRVLATYYEAYAPTVNTFKITDIPMSFNVIYLFNARFNSDGSVYWPFTDVTSAQVQQCRARGQKVFLTCGGAGVQFVFTNRTHTTNFVSSFISMANSLGGVDGVDWNNFEGSLNSGNYAAFATEASWAVSQLRAEFGANFGSTSPAGGNTKGDQSDRSWASAMNAAGALTWINPQFYDWEVYKLAGFISGYTPAASTDYGTNCNADWVSTMGGDASKVVIGFGANYWGYNLPAGQRHSYYELATTLNESIREWDAAVGQFSNQRGVFCWNAYLNSAPVNQYGDASSDGNNTWGSTFRAKLDALDYVVPAPAPAPNPIGAQDAIDAAPPGAVLDMTGRTYSGSLLIDKALTLKGLSVSSSAGQSAVTVTASDVTLDHVTLQGPQATTYDADAIGIEAIGTSSSPVYRLKVLDSVITRYGNSGITGEFVYDAQILRNRIEDVVYSGIMVLSAQGGLIKGNAVRRIGVYGAAENSNNAYGIAVSSSNPSVNPQSADVVVDGNVVEDVPTWHGLDTHAGLRIEFTNNVVRRARDGIYVTGDSAGRRNEDVITSGNRIEAPAGADQYGITSVYSTGGSITNNNIIGYPSGHEILTTSSGLPDATAIGLTISGNFNNSAAPLPGSSTGGVPSITTAAHEYEFLQAGNPSQAYWIEDNRWGQGSVTSFMQEVGRSLTVGPNGEVAARFRWNWPAGDNEVKGYPSILYGRKPGYASSSFKPAGKTVILPDGSISTAAPSGWTPGTFLPQKHPISSLKAYANTAHLQTPTGKGHVSYDLWLQSAPQQDQGFVSSSITHEIMIPLRHWGGYGSQEQRAPGWYYGDVTIGGRTYKVYNPNPSGFASFTYLDGSYGRSGWKFIVFEAATADMPISGELPLHEFIAYTIAHFPTTGSEYCSSVELGVEPEEGTGDVVIYDYRVYT